MAIEKLKPDKAAALTAPVSERGARCRASDSRNAAAVLFTDSTGSRDSAGALGPGWLCSTRCGMGLLFSDAEGLNSESHHS